MISEGNTDGEVAGQIEPLAKFTAEARLDRQVDVRIEHTETRAGSNSDDERLLCQVSDQHKDAGPEVKTRLDTVGIDKIIRCPDTLGEHGASADCHIKTEGEPIRDPVRAVNTDLDFRPRNLLGPSRYICEVYPC